MKGYGKHGIHMVHSIINGPIKDSDAEEVVREQYMNADAVGREYLHLVQQEPTVWTHELDLRPAQEMY